MSKALVIIGVDFSTNKLTKDTFVENIPCTGITFSNSSISITSYTPVEIEYTLSPADTTDQVTWASSDTDVATVSGGVVTAVGLGTCTITATCGSFSASATITVNIAYTLSAIFARMGSEYDSSMTLIEAYGRGTTLGSGSMAADYPFVRGTNISADYYPIVLPKNTKSITVSITSDSIFNNSADTNVKWFKNEAAGGSSTANNIKYVSAEDAYNIKSNTSKSFNVPEGADAVAVTTRFLNTYTSADNDTSVLTSGGFSITFSTSTVN